MRAGKLIWTRISLAGGVALLAGAALSVPADALQPGRPPFSQWVQSAAMAGLGLFFLCWPLSGKTRPRRRGPINRATISGEKVKERSPAWLRRNGIPLDAEVIAFSPTMTDQRKMGWQIIARGLGPKTHKTYTFRSDPLRFNPSEHIEQGQFIPVLVDPDNPKAYWVDTTGLMEGTTA